MKTIVAILLIFPALLSAALAADDINAKFLNRVILTLPAKYFADIPLEDRPEMLAILSAKLKDSRLDYDNHCLFWSRDSEREQGRIKPSADLAVKLLPRFADRDFSSPYPPFVFVCLNREANSDTATASTDVPKRNQAFVLMKKRDEWIDVSDKLIPESIDRTRLFQPQRKFHGIAVFENRRDLDYQPTRKEQLLIWEDEKLQLREPFPFYTDCTTDVPFDPDELATLALTPEKDPRRLMWLIVYAGLEADQRFRYLLDSGELKKNDSLALALASYEYAIDQTEASLDFITAVMKREGGGDTNSLLVISYMDEWDRTAEAFRNHRGGDGAAGEARGMFLGIRLYLYPEKYRQHRDKFPDPKP